MSNQTLGKIKKKPPRKLALLTELRKSGWLARLSLAQSKVFLVYYDFLHSRRCTAYPSLRTLVKTTGMVRASVCRTLRQLDDLGLLVMRGIEPKYGRTIREFCIPSQALPQAKPRMKKSNMWATKGGLRVRTGGGLRVRTGGGLRVRTHNPLVKPVRENQEETESLLRQDETRQGTSLLPLLEDVEPEFPPVNVDEIEPERPPVESERTASRRRAALGVAPSPTREWHGGQVSAPRAKIEIDDEPGYNTDGIELLVRLGVKSKKLIRDAMKGPHGQRYGWTAIRMAAFYKREEKSWFPSLIAALQSPGKYDNEFMDPPTSELSKKELVRVATDELSAAFAQDWMAAEERAGAEEAPTRTTWADVARTLGTETRTAILQDFANRWQRARSEDERDRIYGEAHDGVRDYGHEEIDEFRIEQRNRLGFACEN